MQRLRPIVGILAVVAALAALNVIVLEKTFFHKLVLVFGALGGGAGLIWIGLGLFGRDRQGQQFTVYGFNAVVSSLVMLGICVTLYAFVRRADVSWDLTQEGRRELSPQTVQVLEGLKEDVEITCFFVHGGEASVDLAQDKTRRFLERCQAYSTRLKTEFIDPQQHPERVEELNSLRIRISVVGTIVIKSGVRTREIPLSDVTQRLEERDFVNALINVTRNSRPKVYFLTGHGERDIENLNQKDGGSDFREWLRKEAYEVAKHLIPVTNPFIPEDCSLLIINGLKSDLHYHEIQVLDEYLSRGGRMLVLLDPAMVVGGILPSQEQLRPWLSQRLGVNVGTDIIVSLATQSLKSMFIPDFKALGDLAGDQQPEPGFRGSFNANHPVTRASDQQMILSGLRSVTFAPQKPEGVTRVILLRTTPDTWAETDLKSLTERPAEGERRSLIPDPGELRGPVSVAVAVTMRTDVPVGDGSRTLDARVIVMGDADISSNEGIDWGYSSNMLLNMTAWLTESEELIAIRATGTEDRPIVLSERDQQAVAWIAILGPVQAVALVGFIVLGLRRRNR